jgi:hypothetical protein
MKSNTNGLLTDSSCFGRFGHVFSFMLGSLLWLYTQLLLRSTGHGDDQRRKLKTVLSSGEHLLEML